MLPHVFGIHFWPWIMLFQTLLTRIPNGIAFICCLRISSILHDKHLVILPYRDCDCILNKRCIENYSREEVSW